jgi:hypothetical protein
LGTWFQGMASSFLNNNWLFSGGRGMSFIRRDKAGQDAIVFLKDCATIEAV